MEMKMNHWKWEGMGLKNIFQLISSGQGQRTFEETLLIMTHM